MRALALLLLTVAGCDLVFGVDPGQGDGPDADLDATPSSELVRVRIDVDVVTTVVTREPGALDLGRSYVLVDDQVPARRVELTEVAVGEYTAPVPVGAGFRLVRPDPVSGVLHVSELPARDQRWASTFVGHRDEVPASKSDAFELDILRDGAGVSSCVLLVTGAWLSGLVPGCEDSGSLSLVTGPIRWSTLTSISGRPAARPQAGDLVYLLRYLGGSTAGALVDVGPVFVPGTTLISGSMAATTINQRAELTVIDHGLEARLRAADPTPSAAAGVQRWDVYAMWSVPALFAGLGLVGSADGFTAGAISTSFANPFAWPAYVVVQQTFERDTTVGVAPPFKSYTGAYVYAADLGSAGAPVSLHADGAVPTQVVMDGTALSTDGVMVDLPAGPIEVNVVVDGTADSYTITISRGLDDGGPLRFEPVFVASSAVGPSFSIPEGVLVVGQPYQIRAYTTRGLPGLSAGDTTPGLPLATAYHDSAVFMLVP